MLLWLVLLLVLASAGMLVTALANSATPWAWVSVGASAAAGDLLIADWVRRRRTAHRGALGPLTAGAAGADSAADPDVEPAEESTDVADAIVVSELADKVVVIDERPRYHLAGCPWVGERPTAALPVAEARDLGFTPCASCAPDSTLAAARRTAGQ